MDHMDHSSHESEECKVEMMWNWNTIHACFISSSWHITSHGMFAGSCIGVVLLAITLELLRRSTKEYDRFLVRQHHARSLDAGAASSCCKTGKVAGAEEACAVVPPFRPNVWQQAVRATLHMAQFAVAYFLMLLAMYYNGYFIICIFIGVYIGGFLFQWENLSKGSSGDRTSAANEATVCCG